VQNLNQAVKSVKDPGNTFDINPKWERTFPSFDNLAWDIYRVSQKYPNIKVDISHPDVGLRCRIPLRHLSQLQIRQYR
jgi:hypothetical protein